MNDATVCTECGIEFDPLPWSDPHDPICDACIEDILTKEAGDEPWR